MTRDELLTKLRALSEGGDEAAALTLDWIAEMKVDQKGLVFQLNQWKERCLSAESRLAAVATAPIVTERPAIDPVEAGRGEALPPAERDAQHVSGLPWVNEPSYPMRNFVAEYKGPQDVTTAPTEPQ